MTTLDAGARPAPSVPPALFAVTIFTSAGLVFLVQPMVAKLVLPLLGGSPSVWNTSMAFFQAALLAGYGYAHLLQRVASVKTQTLVHLGALVAAALVLPLNVSEAMGAPSSDHPNLWLLGVLALSIGAPFAVLSATAPLVQAWHARVVHSATGQEPYVLYAASNLGSLLALLAYPILVEPLSTLQGQTLGWSLAYGAFVLLMGALALGVGRAGLQAQAVKTAEVGPAPSWRERLTWLALAAAPSSLMLGVTTHITTDVASAPFLWVAPLALYLLTFIIAFSAKPVIRPSFALLLQAAAVALCAAVLPFRTSHIVSQLAIHLLAFFATALVCHQALVARRPAPAHLTEFYLWMSLGGVVGGSFNAFLAPVIFNNVWEYPLVLALACLARPWHPHARLEAWRWAVLALACLLAASAPGLVGMSYGQVYPQALQTFTHEQLNTGAHAALGLAVLGAFLLRDRGLMFFAVVVAISIGATAAGDTSDVKHSWRSFFGVVRQSEMTVPGYGGGALRMLAHGTTLHGAQAVHPDYDCRPLAYYAFETPIGQVFERGMQDPRELRIGAVGLGAGTVAAYTQPGDRLTFFEIDPLVVRIATDPKHFSYTTTCALGRIDYVIGDARLTLGQQPDATFDVLLIDAFSSDAVPAHLLTVEAVRGYFKKLKPDGLLILHLSNRNLDLRSPAAAVLDEVGAYALMQRHEQADGTPPLWESTEDAILASKSAEALRAYVEDGRWEGTDPAGVRPWTDDYTNLVGALVRRMREKGAF